MLDDTVKHPDACFLRYTDFLNVMAYDLHGDWDNYTGHPSQLYPREEEYGPATEVNVVSPLGSFTVLQLLFSP